MSNFIFKGTMTILQTIIDAMSPKVHILLEVHFVPGKYQSSLRAKKNFQSGEVICDLSKAQPAPRSRFTVQTSVDEHVELHSDLVFTNHSCEPNIAFDVSSDNRDEWKVIALEDIESGQELTFFYPSTEWDASDPFDCECGAKTCLKSFRGAKSIPRVILERQKYISPHIWRLVNERDDK